LALGMAEYRSGHYVAAEEALLAAEKAGPNGKRACLTCGGSSKSNSRLSQGSSMTSPAGTSPKRAARGWNSRTP
jgi:hypothetical protein